MKCQGLFGAIFGHNFKPIFNETYDTKGLKIDECPSAYAAEIAESMANKTKTYVKTECTRCGNPAASVSEGE